MPFTQENIKVLQSTELFTCISRDNLISMLRCLEAEKVKYPKDTIVLMAGNKPEYVGVVIENTVRLIKEDMEGNRSIIATLGPGELFAEGLCCAGVTESPITVQTNTGATVLQLRFSRILHACPMSCEFHQQLIQNTLKIIALENLFLQNRMELATLRSIRSRLTTYLNSLAAKQGQEIVVPMNREELADYLFVERSALSHELMKMKRDGLIDYRKNRFILL